ncbi:MAG: alpha/beta hydrolase family protein [Verrucomicrobiota bacterium]|nr:alpha/beta hydrolase family protein [Verrucomicrobiota bacterium]
MNYNFAPSIASNNFMENSQQKLAFSSDCDFQQWRSEVDSKLRKLLGMDNFDKVDLNIQVEYKKEYDDYYETRFVFTSEYKVDVPAHLLIPKKGKGPFPVMICLQGHSSGMHISLGRPKYEGDEESIAGDRDFGIQAVKEGYAALVLEQRAFGERKNSRSEIPNCVQPSMLELLMGRCMIATRSWDISRAIDALSHFDNIDFDKIGCMGNSGGGTITFFATCLDERIKMAMPSCYFCTLKESIGRIEHCVDNYIPGMLQWFDLPDLTCLIVPRPMLIVAGKTDGIFPLSGVESAFKTTIEIYKKAGVEDKCKLFVGSGGHRFYKDAWKELERLI